MPDSPWGGLFVNDAHVHFFAHTFYAGLSRQNKLDGAGALAPLLGWVIPEEDPVHLGAQWIREMDSHGVRRSCLIASSHSDEASVAAAVGACPDRSFGYFMLDPTQPDALKRVTSAARNPHVHRMCVFQAMHTY